MQPHNGCGLKVGVTTLVKEPPFKFPGSALEMGTHLANIGDLVITAKFLPAIENYVVNNYEYH